MVKVLEFVGHGAASIVEETGRIGMMLVQSLVWVVRPPFFGRLIIKQMEFVGVKSISVVILTGVFTGMVMAFQSYYGFSKFGAETMVGAAVALAMTRELGPVLTALMVNARAGSAMAAELGTMRVTEQIDALTVTAVNPVNYLVMPRVVASVIILPVLCIITDYVGVLGGYVISCGLLKVNPGMFIGNIYEVIEVTDIFNGLIKASVFGMILALVGCYKGFFARGGAEGVGKATTEAVVLSSILILVFDYILTALMF
jgi:phospholipid/cholesterol/gamma-HCH transport system permease protein